MTIKIIKCKKFLFKPKNNSTVNFCFLMEMEEKDESSDHEFDNTVYCENDSDYECSEIGR